MTELKRCPFCNGEASLYCEEHTFHHHPILVYCAICDTCGASSRSKSINKLLVLPAEHWDNPASRQVEEWWNTRTEKGS
ncbi:MAG: hypothetical protein IKB78_06320 [Clostridia bacterium]|nr:hypothetical protein [Clostridia bacterium]